MKIRNSLDEMREVVYLIPENDVEKTFLRRAYDKNRLEMHPVSMSSSGELGVTFLNSRKHRW